MSLQPCFYIVVSQFPSLIKVPSLFSVGGQLKYGEAKTKVPWTNLFLSFPFSSFFRPPYRFTSFSPNVAIFFHFFSFFFFLWGWGEFSLIVTPSSHLATFVPSSDCDYARFPVLPSIIIYCIRGIHALLWGIDRASGLSFSSHSWVGLNRGKVSFWRLSSSSSIIPSTLKDDRIDEKR